MSESVIKGINDTTKHKNFDSKYEDIMKAAEKIILK